MASPNTPGVNARLSYVNGLQLTWVSTTSFTCAIGACADSGDTNDIISPSVLTCLTNKVGPGGVDIAVAVASTMYAVYLIGDSQDFNPTALLMSLAVSSVPAVNTQPSLPFGYDMYRRIGYVLTDSSAHVLQFWHYAHNIARTMYYDTPIATPAITTATTYASQSLIAGVPPIACEAILKITFTPNTASDVAQFAPYGSSPTTAMLAFGYGSDASVAQVGMLKCPCALNATVPTITHKETSASDALVIAVSGYVDNL